MLFYPLLPGWETQIIYLFILYLYCFNREKRFIEWGQEKPKSRKTSLKREGPQNAWVNIHGAHSDNKDDNGEPNRYKETSHKNKLKKIW